MYAFFFLLFYSLKVTSRSSSLYRSPSTWIKVPSRPKTKILRAPLSQFYLGFLLMISYI